MQLLLLNDDELIEAALIAGLHALMDLPVHDQQRYLELAAAEPRVIRLADCQGGRVFPASAHLTPRLCCTIEQKWIGSTTPAADRILQSIDSPLGLTVSHSDSFLVLPQTRVGEVF